MTDGDWICKGWTRWRGFDLGVGATTDTNLEGVSFLFAATFWPFTDERPSFLGTGGGKVDVYDIGGGGLGGVSSSRLLAEPNFGGDGLGGVLLFRELESRVMTGLRGGVSLRLRCENESDFGVPDLGGLSVSDVLAGLRNILYMCTTFWFSSGSREGSGPMPDAPSESLNVK